MTTLQAPDTPFLALDVDRVDANIARLRQHLDLLGTPLRLHVKTAKSVDVAARAFGGGTGPITVSTLAEAEYFADAGWTDILYAVGLDPHKLPRAQALVERGVDLTMLLDSITQADALVQHCRTHGVTIPALIEIDCDGHRGGIRPDSADLIPIGRRLADAGCLRGVLDHAGESYFATTADDQRAAAGVERVTVLDAADRLRQADFACPVVSVGSTPTAHATAELTGVTEVRAGNFVFFDLVMAGIGVCRVADLALSVVVTVIGHHGNEGIFTDGGWMATSRDRGTAQQAVDQGYGLVADIDGVLIPDLLMVGASQEHGVLSIRPGSSRRLPHLPIGTRLRILPNHACATAAQHSRYLVHHGGSTDVVSQWPRHNGW
ncbi:alanine racemase [Ruania alba]|uniref:D-serine deaminase, pyridoxal phosphate-dependent n=1 Tax=Ruania alba TaxID=648782 RepID=A0A1H5LJP9_9MICO|nr:alanine racemase [Ruania alba]SEE77229.1 D-serine deaminase, pyridoxal phosphate-dependent [Ruania alba]